ncbi:molybdenum cofactor biosynthesis protein MoaE [Pseudoxanthomonas suwonensis]|uniref:molybdenum cofactor biosynthesis protein MoaE n=1 Tax=Pseudoxanthomonas suwonensis TaxID=314722 RepID=UPI00048FEA6A|nr:molybdenum cofactor biosynthesis protein MoaE [Pseudoxanthomonas suwonensis]
MAAVQAKFELAAAPFAVAPLRERLLDDAAGAYASFEGWVRNHNDGRPVHGLMYEAYAALAEAEGQRIVEEAAQRFAITGVHCVHRTGELAIGELAVWVGVGAGHRDAAFAACRWVIDEVKARVPIWKHERYADGDRQWLHPVAATTEGSAPREDTP